MNLTGDTVACGIYCSLITNAISGQLQTLQLISKYVLLIHVVYFTYYDETNHISIIIKITIIESRNTPKDNTFEIFILFYN